MNFGQLIEYNERNIFPQKPCRKWLRDTSSRPIFVFWSRDMLNFVFFKASGNNFPVHLMYGFSRKMFLVLYSRNWSNFIVSLLSLLEILGNMCIAIACFPGCDVINFDINLIFLIKPFFYMTNSSRQKFEHLENKKSF